MTGTANGLARRSDIPAVQQSAALELRSSQTMWTKDQHAALVAMGIPREASSAELGVFLHQCQRTGLDPFSKQIYLIYRPSFENGRTVSKPTTQVGIDGFRVIRDRIARRDGLSVEYGDTLWYAADGQAYDVWLWGEPPAACKFVVLVDGRRFPATLNFNEYVQKKKDGTVNKMWTEKPAHMIEKCAEADALRRAFPNDMAGVILEDAAPLAEDTPEPRQRVTAEQARARAPQTVTAEVVTPDVPSAGEQPQPPSAAADNAPPEPAGGTRKPQAASSGQVGMIRKKFADLYPGEETPEERLQRLGETTALAERAQLIGSTKDLTADEAARVIRKLGDVKTAEALAALLKDGEVPSGE
jgi:phage recombination protein Bet